MTFTSLEFPLFFLVILLLQQVVRSVPMKIWVLLLASYVFYMSGSVAGVFLIVSLAWIFFRAATLSDAWLVVSRIARFSWTDPACPMLLLAAVAAVWAYQAIYESRFRSVLAAPPVRIALVVAMILAVALFAQSGSRDFIYYQF